MSESRDVRTNLITGENPAWRDMILPVLLEFTDFVTVTEERENGLQGDAELAVIACCGDTGAAVEMAARIRCDTPEVPVILLLESSTRGSLLAALEASATSVLFSPFRKDQVTAALTRCSILVAGARSRKAHRSAEITAAQFMANAPWGILEVNGTEGRCLNPEAARACGMLDGSVFNIDQLCDRFYDSRGGQAAKELVAALRKCQPWRGILSRRAGSDSRTDVEVFTRPIADPSGAPLMAAYLHEVAGSERIPQLVVSRQACADLIDLLQHAPDGESRWMLDAWSQIGCWEGEEARGAMCTDLRHTITLATAEAERSTGRPVAFQVSLPDYLPQHYDIPSPVLRLALKAVLDGCSRFTADDVSIAASLKERTSNGVVLNWCFRTRNPAFSTNLCEEVGEYLDRQLVACNGEGRSAAFGLGLFARICGALGGSVAVRSERGKGRAVCCTMPLYLATQGAAPGIAPVAASTPEAPADASPAPLKILVAEDNVVEQMSIRRMLEGAGYSVVVVDNGQEAVDEVEAGDFDVVFMDILMPKMDGFTATSLIRDRERIAGGRTRILALTSYSLPAIKEKCDSVGMDGYVAKPVSKQNLLGVLRQLEKEPPGSAVAGEGPGIPVLDTKLVLENLGNDVELYRSIVSMYRQMYRSLPDDLVLYLSGADLRLIEKTAHSLKGVAANLGAQRMTELAREIQDTARAGHKPDAEVLSPRVRQEAAALMCALDGIDWESLGRPLLA